MIDSSLGSGLEGRDRGFLAGDQVIARIAGFLPERQRRAVRIGEAHVGAIPRQILFSASETRWAPEGRVLEQILPG